MGGDGRRNGTGTCWSIAIPVCLSITLTSNRVGLHAVTKSGGGCSIVCLEGSRFVQMVFHNNHLLSFCLDTLSIDAV